jgi:gluconolactonase
VEGIEQFDPRMKALVLPESRLEKLASGATWSEGPVYFHEDDSLIWSDIPQNRLLRWSRDGLSEYLKPAHFQNGHYRDREGHLIACSHGRRCIERLGEDGLWYMLVDSFQGKRLNSPNDVVVKSDGTIWFTDPSYGLIQPHEGYGGQQEQEGCFVYRFDPVNNQITAVVRDMQMPNGLAFSPDESLLYISDTSASHDPNGNHHIRVYEVRGKTLVKGRIFAVIEPGLPDGFRLDIHGNIFTSSGDSIQVYAPDGYLIGKIMVPEKVGNCTFGGKNKDRLFIVASSSLYAITLNTKGIQRP